MFEKLKEYGLYIVLGLIALGALAFAYLNTTNTQKGGEVMNKLQDTLISAISKNVKVKDVTTIVDHMSEINGLSIGQYKLDTTAVTVLNLDGDTIATTTGDQSSLDVTAAGTTTGAGKLQLTLIPNTKIKGAADGKYELITKSAKGVASTDAQFKAMNEQLRGFLATGYVGFGTFASEKDAKEFRDSYFSTGIVVQKDATNAIVLMEIAR